MGDDTRAANAIGGFMMQRVMDEREIRRPPEQRIVLAHDWLVGLRGGEWVLDRLARLFGPTDLYTLVNDGRYLTDAIAKCNVITSPLQRLPGARGRARRWYLPLMPWAVQRLRVRSTIGASERSRGPHPGPLPKGERVSLLISTSSAVMKSIIPPPGVPHLCYCHSPARYVWEQADEYAAGKWGGLRSMGLRAVRKRFQAWDGRSASRVTKFLANSEHTRRRIERCYGREATVVHPPVRTEFFTPDESVQREDWLLAVAALEPYKKTEIAIEAARRAGLALKVVGTGSQFASLRKVAGDSRGIEMLGRVDDPTLRDLYRRAKALVFPQLEDFGIIAAEAQACGCPVIAYGGAGGGGAMDIITRETGVFMRKQSADAAIDAMNELALRSIDARACRINAMRFSEARFDAAILREVDALIGTKRERT